MTPAGLELVAFDLDNTLYDEGQYFRGAFPPIAAHLARVSGMEAARIEARLAAVLDARGRHYHHLFDDVLREIGLEPAAHLASVLGLFQAVQPRLTLFPGVEDLLDALGRRYRLGLITSGMAAVQENKLRLLGIRDRFAHVVLSSTLPENKPGPMPFRRLLQALGVAPTRAVYVGDNPLVDFRGANAIGMWTIRVRNPEFDGLLVSAGDDARYQVAVTADLGALLL